MMENLSANKKALMYIPLLVKNTSQVLFHASFTECWTVCLSEQEFHD